MHILTFSPKSMVTDEDIAERAYVLWLKRGRPKGYESEIWRDARNELQAAHPLRKGKARFLGTSIKNALVGLCGTSR